MGTPKKVLEQEAAAEKLHKEVYGGVPAGEEPAPETDVEPADPEPEVVETLPADPEFDPAPAPAPQPAPAPDDSNWKAKYAVLKGKYDSEVPVLHERIDALNDLVLDLNRRLAVAEAGPAPAPPAPPSPGTVVGRAADESLRATPGGPDIAALREQYGDEWVDTMLAVAKGATNELAQRVDNLTASQERSSKDRLFSAMDAALPDWRRINNDPEFIAWLSELDPIWNLPRQAALDNAVDQRDLRRTLAFFENWLASQGAPPNGRHTGERLNPPPLDSQVQPRTVRGQHGPSPTAPQQGRIWTDASIAQFYRDWNRKVFSDAEAQKLERDIIRAPKEGRYRPK